MTKREKLHEIFDRLKDGERLHVISDKNQPYQGLSFSMIWNGNWRNSTLRCAEYGYWAHRATLENLEYELDNAGSYEVESDAEFQQRTGKDFFGWGL